MVLVKLWVTEQDQSHELGKRIGMKEAGDRDGRVIKDGRGGRSQSILCTHMKLSKNIIKCTNFLKGRQKTC